MNLIDDVAINGLFESARQSERKRAHLLLHRSHDEKVQRLLIGLVKDSYVEPHYHELANQWEMFTVLTGELKITLYETDGTVKKQFIAGPSSSVSIVEFSPGDIHSVECISDIALMLEVKEGPFNADYAKAFPHWG